MSNEILDSAQMALVPAALRAAALRAVTSEALAGARLVRQSRRVAGVLKWMLVSWPDAASFSCLHATAAALRTLVGETKYYGHLECYNLYKKMPLRAPSTNRRTPSDPGRALSCCKHVDWTAVFGRDNWPATRCYDRL